MSAMGYELQPQRRVGIEWSTPLAAATRIRKLTELISTALAEQTRYCGGQ